MSENCPTPDKHQPKAMPVGNALFDYDGDGLLDMYLVNDAEMPSLEKSGPKYNNRLLHNNGNGTFIDVTAKNGLGDAVCKGRKMWSIAAGWFDYNNDGLLDLFVANYC